MNTKNLSYERTEKPFLEIESQPIIVVCAADNNYAMQVAVTLRSAVANLKGDRKMILFILDGGIKKHNKQKILKSLNSEKCEVKFIAIPDSLLRDELEEINKNLGPDGKTISQYISISTFFRMFIPEILPSEINKAIYLDCDLVVRENLEELWQVDLGKNHILVAQDTWIRTVSNSNGLLNYRELGIPSEAKYFNAGVLVINLKKWREDEICVKAMNYLRQNRKYVRWHDQDVLNPILVEKWGQLDPRWNFNATSFYDYTSKDYLPWNDGDNLFSKKVYDDLVQNPYIVHFVSANKPWTSRHCPRKEEFFKYVDLTEWSGWRLTIWRRLWLRANRELRQILSK